MHLRERVPAARFGFPRGHPALARDADRKPDASQPRRVADRGAEPGFPRQPADGDALGVEFRPGDGERRRAFRVHDWWRRSDLPALGDSRVSEHPWRLGATFHLGVHGQQHGRDRHVLGRRHRDGREQRSNHFGCARQRIGDHPAEPAHDFELHAGERACGEQRDDQRRELHRGDRGDVEHGGRELLGRNPNSKKAASPTPSSSDSKSEPNLVGGMKFTPLEEGLAGALSGMVRPVIRRGTRLIDLYITNRDPVMAQRLAEAVGREYIRNSIEHRAAFSQESLRYLLEEEERLKVNLQKSEVAVAEYKEKTPDALQLGGGAAATGSQAGAGAGAGGSRGGLVEDKLQELSTKLTAAKSERLRLESELNQVEEAGNNLDELLAVPSVAAAPMVNERRRDVAQMEGTIAALAQRYKDKHPKMIGARASMKEAQQSLRQAVLAQPALLRNAIEQATHAEESLQAAANAQEKAALALNKAAIGYQELARQAETDRALYESVLRQIKETNLTKDVKTNAVSIAEHASLPHGPVSPIPSKAITLGLLAGLVAGLTFVFGADALDRSIKTVDQAEAILGLPVLAAVPETRSAELKKGNKGAASRDGAITYRVVEEAPEGPVAEAFRNLRASLSLLGPEPDRKTFLFTSALPTEGKSFTSVNYALALAQQGHRVLLIDGDLRRPSIHKVFQQADNQARRLRSDEMMGIVDYLVGTAELRDAARTVLTADAETFVDRTNRGAAPRRGELSILAGGRRAPNPAELLSGYSFKELLAEAAEHYDRVVIDSAPILAVSDTLLMVPYVQTSCMVVRANRTPRNAVSRAASGYHWSQQTQTPIFPRVVSQL